jgi:hypothetical protein
MLQGSGVLVCVFTGGAGHFLMSCVADSRFPRPLGGGQRAIGSIGVKKRRRKGRLAYANRKVERSGFFLKPRLPEFLMEGVAVAGDCSGRSGPRRQRIEGEQVTCVLRTALLVARLFVFALSVMGDVYVAQWRTS